jgi:hypothetical protein
VLPRVAPARDARSSDISVPDLKIPCAWAAAAPESEQLLRPSARRGFAVDVSYDRLSRVAKSPLPADKTEGRLSRYHFTVNRPGLIGGSNS